MVIVEKKLQFAGLAEEDEDESDEEPQPTESSAVANPSTPEESEEEDEDALYHEAAEKVVQEVLSRATEIVTERLEQIAALEFPITFDQAPEDIKDAATRFIKEIVGKAVAMAEEKAVPTVPFNFEDVDLMKTSGPWYIRAREALVRVLRTACFCTPRRHDS